METIMQEQKFLAQHAYELEGEMREAAERGNMKQAAVLMNEIKKIRKAQSRLAINGKF